MNNLNQETSFSGDTQDYIARKFTSNLQAFHHFLSEFDWKQNIPECVFIRDFENLPVSASFDIDLMANEDTWPAIIELFKSAALASGLVCLYRMSHGGLFILVFDVCQNKGERSWSYYEIRKQLPLTDHINLTSNDIDISDVRGLPIPTKSWQFLLFLHQGLRKGKIEKYKASLISMRDENIEVQSLCCNLLGLSTDDIQSIILKPNSLDIWRDKIGVRYAVGKTPPSISIFSKLKKKLSKKIYIWNTKGPMFFTIHGPDGVGKTTVLDEISKIINEYPFSHEVFHHITSWKRNLNNQHEGKVSNVLTYDGVPLWRKVLRIVYRNLHPALQALWIHSSNYIKYSSNLNRHILEQFYNHKVIVCDRYIYDLWAKYQVTPGYIKKLHPLHYFYNKIFRFPVRAFVLNDEPEKIYKRKQELSIDQIASYQNVMDNIIKDLKVPATKIVVSEKKPKEIAKEIVTVILNDMNPDIFYLVREEVAREHSQNINYD